VPLNDFSVFDLARACRQKLYLEFVVPYALIALEQNVAAGELYDGELAAAIASIPASFWREHPPLTCSMIPIMERAAADQTLVDDARQNCTAFLGAFDKRNQE
jgi:hypothetical protein